MISIPWKQKQENNKFKASLSYKVTAYLKNSKIHIYISYRQVLILDFGD